MGTGEKERKKRVILVEDEAVIAMDEASVLSSAGFDVTVLGSGKEAVEAATTMVPPPDLILMDIDLGSGMDGAEAARRILRVREIPILFLSSHTESAIVEKTEEISSYGYLVKPVAPTVLFASIRMAFRLYDARLKILVKNMEIEQASEELRQSEEELITSSRELEESEQRFRLLVENSFDAIFIQMDGIIEYCNASALKLFGAERREQLAGAMVLERFHPDYRDLVRKRIESLNQRREIAPRLEEKILRFDGESVDVEVYAVPFSLSGKNGALVYLHDLTERKKAEQKMIETNTLLELMSSMAQIGGWEFDPRTGKGSWTEEVARIHEIDPEAPTDMSLGLSFFHGESRRKIEEAVRMAVETGTPYDLELELTTAKGNRKWVRTIGRIQETASGRKIAGTFQDITQAKRAEEKIRARNERYAAIVENTSDWIVRLDAESRFLYMNPSASRFLGVQGDSYLGRNIAELGYPEDLSLMWENETRKVFSSKQMGTVQFEIPHVSGVRSFELKLCPEFGSSSEVIRVIGIARDVTERVEMENATRSLARQFQAMFMDHKAVMLLIAPQDGEILAANSAASRYYGYSPEILCSMHIHDINRLPKEEVDMEMNAAKEEKRNYFVFPHHLASGEVRTVEVFSSPIEIGTQKLLFSVIHDITDRCRAESALAQALREKEVMFKELQHRVKNNLSVISGLLTFELDAVGDTKAKEVLINAKTRIMSIARIYDNLCRGFDVEEVEMGTYMREFIASLYDTYVFDKERIRFTQQIESFSLDLKRAVPLCLIINELVTNSLKYAYPAPAKGEIRISIAIAEGVVEVAVSDDGVGRTFDTSEREESMGERLVAMLSSQIGGALTSESREGRGMLVRLRMKL